MLLFFILALTFTLSAQQDKKDDADAEYMENGNEMMKKVMNAIGEEGQEEVMNGLDEYSLEKLTECLESECEMTDFTELMQKILSVLKQLSHGDKLIYKLIKELIKDGPLAELVKELSEEDTMKTINALDAKDIDKLMNIGKGPIDSHVLSLGKKILPILMKATGGKGLPKLMSMFNKGGNEKKALPYHHPVSGGLHAGMSVYVQGMMPKDSERFLLDFASCQHQGANIPLHFNPQFDAENIVLNTFHAGRWGKEERHQNPFRKGEHFEAIFMVTETGYQMLVNRKPFGTYKHRIPPQSVQDISVDGDLELQSLAVTEGPMMGNMNQAPRHRMITFGEIPTKDGRAIATRLSLTINLSLVDSILGWLYISKARCPNTLKHFRVNFACQGNDIPLHFIPTFVWNHIGLNTFQNGIWGKEDKRHMVLQKGEHFEVVFIVTETGYKVLLNRKPFCTYKHRMPAQRVRDINVDGYLELQSLTVIGGPMTGNTSMMPNTEHGTPTNLPVLTGPVIYYPPVPYTGYIPRDLGANRTIAVQGFILKNAKSFEIKFMAGEDIALRINPRMKERIVVRNSFLKGSWGPEENDLPFNPFQRGQYFELSISYDKREFQVYTKGQPFFKYARRYLPIEQVRTLKIAGDVTLSYIKY